MREKDQLENEKKFSHDKMIEHFYDQEPLIEWQRLEFHRMEFAITLRAILEYLPSPPQTVLDIGGGPGRYTLTLTARGYKVTLLDLSQGNLKFAQEKAQELGVFAEQYIHGNALDLSTFQPSSFDAVLLLGPLYHLAQEDDRRQAIREARRVLRPDGLIFSASIGRFSPFRDLARRLPEALNEHWEYWQEVLQTGNYHTQQSLGFTNAYFVHPNEIRPFFESEGFQTLDLIGCEGVISQLETQVNQLPEESWDRWVNLNYQLGKEPSLHGAADHLLYVGRKKDM